MKRFTRVLLRGLVIVGPIGLTFYLIGFIVLRLDEILGGWMKNSLPEGVYRTGMGLLLACVVVLLVGLLTEFVFVRALVDLAEDLIERLPLVKSIYGSLRDLAGFFDSSRHAKGAQQVVLVSPAQGPGKLLGLVTRGDLSDLPAAFGGKDYLAVYIPLSYAWGGYTIIVPRSAVEVVDMTVEEAVRFSVTAGMSANVEEDKVIPGITPKK